MHGSCCCHFASGSGTVHKVAAAASAAHVFSELVHCKYDGGQNVLLFGILQQLQEVSHWLAWQRCMVQMGCPMAAKCIQHILRSANAVACHSVLLVPHYCITFNVVTALRCMQWYPCSDVTALIYSVVLRRSHATISATAAVAGPGAGTNVAELSSQLVTAAMKSQHA